MDFIKIKNITIGKPFTYHKSISADECYELMAAKFNQNYDEWKKHFSLSLIQTPFHERMEKPYSFSIGHKTGGRFCEIYGDIEPDISGSIITIQIKPVLWKQIIIFLLMSLSIYLLIPTGGIPFSALIFFLIFMYALWYLTESVFYLDKFEEILDTICQKDGTVVPMSIKSKPGGYLL